VGTLDASTLRCVHALVASLRFLPRLPAAHTLIVGFIVRDQRESSETREIRGKAIQAGPKIFLILERDDFGKARPTFEKKSDLLFNVSFSTRIARTFRVSFMT